MHLYALKLVVFEWIIYSTPNKRENVATINYSPSMLSAIRSKYLLYWFVYFRVVFKLGFGLGFIWHLYNTHSFTARRRY